MVSSPRAGAMTRHGTGAQGAPDVLRIYFIVRKIKSQTGDRAAPSPSRSAAVFVICGERARHVLGAAPSRVSRPSSSADTAAWVGVSPGEDRARRLDTPRSFARRSDFRSSRRPALSPTSRRLPPSSIAAPRPARATGGPSSPAATRTPPARGLRGGGTVAGLGGDAAGGEGLSGVGRSLGGVGRSRASTDRCWAAPRVGGALVLGGPLGGGAR